MLMPRTGLLDMKDGKRRELPGGGATAAAAQGGRNPATVENSVTHLFEHVAPQYQDRPGGYTRIVPMALRRGDGVLQVRLKLVDYRLPE
jgi:ribosomal protein L17